MRMTRAKAALVVLLILAVAGVGICGGTGEKAAAKGDGKYTIGFSNFSVGNSYRVQMVENIKQTYEGFKKQGVMANLIITNSNLDVNKQIADVKDLITQKVDAIIIAALSPTALSPVCEEAIAKGIVVVSFNSHPETDKITSKVVEDEYLFGQIGGDWLAKKLGGKGNIVILSGIAGNDTNQLRFQGAKDVFDKNPGIKILGEAFAEWDYAKGKVAVENLLAANPQIDGVYSQGGAMTLAAIDAFVEAGRPLVPMVGESNNGFLKAWKKYMGKDTFDSIGPIVRDDTGAIALETAIKALKGEAVPKVTKLQRNVITSADIDKFLKPEPAGQLLVREQAPRRAGQAAVLQVSARAVRGGGPPPLHRRELHVDTEVKKAIIRDTWSLRDTGRVPYLVEAGRHHLATQEFFEDDARELAWSEEYHARLSGMDRLHHRQHQAQHGDRAGCCGPGVRPCSQPGRRSVGETARDRRPTPRRSVTSCPRAWSSRP